MPETRHAAVIAAYDRGYDHAKFCKQQWRTQPGYESRHVITDERNAHPDTFDGFMRGFKAGMLEETETTP